MDLGQQIAVTAMLLLSSKGMAGVPRGSLVVVAAVVPAFGIPTAGIAVLLVIDQLLDMGRTATNILGNAIATAVLGRSHDKASHPGKQDHHDHPEVLEKAELTSVRQPTNKQVRGWEPFTDPSP